MADRSPGYYAVIPASVRYDDSIPANAKLLYGEISALISRDGFCYASNQFFANVYGFSEDTVSRLISKLETAGYIVREIERDNSGQIIRRKLYLDVSTPEGHPLGFLSDTPRIKSREGIGQKVKETNTSNTNIEKENKKERKSKNKTGGSPPETSFDPLPLFVDWIRQTFVDESADRKNDLYFAMVRFSENRTAIKKPFKSKGAITALCNRLQRYSQKAQDPLIAMVDLLDDATSNHWQSIYPPKQEQEQAPVQKGRVYECL